MKRLVYRILAFAIDLLFLNILLIGISNISFINPNISKISEESKNFQEMSKEYNELTNRFEEIFNDNKIDLSESIEINANYRLFMDSFREIPIDEEFDSSVKDEVAKSIDISYKYEYNLYNHNINRYNFRINIIGIIVYILYFGVLEWYLKGQTIGKKIFRLRTVDNDDIKNKIPLWKYLIKAILISEILFTIASTICAHIAIPGHEGPYNSEWYASAYSFIYNIEYIYNTLFLLVIFIRKDERSIHDVLLNMRVALFDKKNKEVKSRIFNEETNNKTN